MISTETYRSLKVRNPEFSKVKQIKYLESILTEKNPIKRNVVSKILQSNESFFKLAKLLETKLRSFSEITKGTLIYITILRSIITYVAEIKLL